MGVPHVIEQARAAIDRGCRIVIYPEGTRRAVLADADYRQGMVRLDTALNVPVPDGSTVDMSSSSTSV